MALATLVLIAYELHHPVISKEYEENTNIRRINTIKSIHDKKQRFPQVIIIGAKKAGTRALIDYLQLHPNIETAKHEVSFFNANYHQGFDWYRQQMPNTTEDQITIEKSPGYCDNKDVPKRVHDWNPDIKILFIVRNPIERLVSDYVQAITDFRHTNKTFEEFVTHNGEINNDSYTVHVSIYHEQYTLWHSLFPKSQIHVVDGDVLITNPIKEISKVEDFLHIPHVVTEECVVFDEAKGFYCRKMTEDNSIKCEPPKKGRPHPDIEEDLLSKLRKFFTPHNELFYNMTGRQFDWPGE